MPDINRERTYTRERDDSVSSEDARYQKKTTVRRYKVGGGGGGGGGHRTRTAVTEREKVVERDRDDFYDRDSRSRVVERKQVVEREDDRWDDRGERRISYEKTKEVERERERDRDRAPLAGRDWDRHARAPWDDREETDVRGEKRGERLPDGEVMVERRFEERRDGPYGGEVERVRKETEYYEPPAPQPIVIRQRAPEQMIIVQLAPAPPPVIVPRQDPGFVVI